MPESHYELQFLTLDTLYGFSVERVRGIEPLKNHSLRPVFPGCQTGLYSRFFCVKGGASPYQLNRRMLPAPGLSNYRFLALRSTC